MLRERAAAKFSRAGTDVLHARRSGAGDHRAGLTPSRRTFSAMPPRSGICAVASVAICSTWPPPSVTSLVLTLIPYVYAWPPGTHPSMASSARSASKSKMSNNGLCPADAWIFFDPGRREGGRRIVNPRDYQPPLSTIAAWLPRAAGIGVKVAPGIDYDHLPWEQYEVEIVSLGGDVKEAVLWFGALARGTRTATVLPAGVSLVYQATAPIDVCIATRLSVRTGRRSDSRTSGRAACGEHWSDQDRSRDRLHRL